VIVNGCTDDTVKLAAAKTGLYLIRLPTPRRMGALNDGDDVAVGQPRIHLDVDVAISAADMRALCRFLAVLDAGHAGGQLAVTARCEVNVSRSSLPIRADLAINARLRVFPHAPFRRDLIVLSADGRNRFTRLPDVVADDLFLGSFLDAARELKVDFASTRIAAPRRTRDLARCLVRVRRANASIRAALPVRSEFHETSRRQTCMSWLSDLVPCNPTLILVGSARWPLRLLP